MCGISSILVLVSPNQNGEPVHPDKLTNGHGRSKGSKIQGMELNGHAKHDAIARELDASLSQINHRGPDSRGQWISKDNRIGPPFPPPTLPLHLKLDLCCLQLSGVFCVERTAVSTAAPVRSSLSHIYL